MALVQAQADGEIGYGATFTGNFSDDGHTLTGGWRPDRSTDAESNVTYDVVMTRVQPPSENE